jgi:predicted ATPase
VEEQSLVGREPELAALAGLIGDAGAGRGRVAVMLGEAGIGKTRLAEAAETMARQSGFDVAWGRCSSADMPSYWPWRQVLNNLLGETSLLDQGRFASPAGALCRHRGSDRSADPCQCGTRDLRGRALGRR